MSLSALADEDLMQLVRRGDTTAFEVVYERHATAAFSLAYRMTGTGNGAEDVVQERFLSLWRSGARSGPAPGWARRRPGRWPRRPASPRSWSTGSCSLAPSGPGCRRARPS